MSNPLYKYTEVSPPCPRKWTVSYGHESWSLVRITKLGTGDVRLLVCRHYFAGTPGHELIAQGTREAMFAAARLMEQHDTYVAPDHHWYVNGANFWNTINSSAVTLGSRIYVDGVAYLVVGMVHDELSLEVC